MEKLASEPGSDSRACSKYHLVLYILQICIHSLRLDTQARTEDCTQGRSFVMYCNVFCAQENGG
jgi:hypothetical protein